MLPLPSDKAALRPSDALLAATGLAPYQAAADDRHAGPLAVGGIVAHLYAGDVDSKTSPLATVIIAGIGVIVTGLRKAITSLDDFPLKIVQGCDGSART